MRVQTQKDDAPDVLKIRELERLTRQLSGAMVRRRTAKRLLKKAEADVKAARSMIRQLLGEDPRRGRAPVCEECSKPLGSNAKCVSCQAAISFAKGGRA